MLAAGSANLRIKLAAAQAGSSPVQPTKRVGLLAVRFGFNRQGSLRSATPLSEILVKSPSD